MCKLTRYEYCLPCDQPLPKEELERCEEWSELAAKAKKGDPTAKTQLKAHMECKHLPILRFFSLVQRSFTEAGLFLRTTER